MAVYILGILKRIVLLPFLYALSFVLIQGIFVLGTMVKGGVIPDGFVQQGAALAFVHASDDGPHPATENSLQTPFQKHIAQYADASVQQVKLQTMAEKFASIPLDKDVHVLDQYVVAHIPQLLEVRDALAVGVDHFDHHVLTKYLKEFYDRHPDVYSEFYDRPKNTSDSGVRSINRETLFHYIDRVFHGLDAPVMKIYSSAITLACDLHAATGDTMPMWHIYNCIVENYQTNGGCYQGRRNRMFGVFSLMILHHGF